MKDSNVDYSARRKDYTYAITVNELPVSREQYDAFLSVLISLKERQDVSLIITIKDHDDPREILIAYSDEAYYAELSFPMDDLNRDYPLLLARDGLTMEEVAELLWLIMAAELDTDDIDLLRHFRDVTADVYPEPATYTAADLEDGTILKGAINAFKMNMTEKSTEEVLCILRDSLVWIPCRTADQQDELRVIPDILQKNGVLYFPVFTAPAEMGDYGQESSVIQKTFPEAIDLASNHEIKTQGIVVNAFTDNFIVPEDLFSWCKTRKSRLKE